MKPPLPELSDAERGRYARHLALPELGATGQARLKRARVLLVGVGGLGSASSLYLAAAGIGRLGLAEFDTVDYSNLQRQVLYDTWQLGRPKLDAARERLQALNPHIEVAGHPGRLTPANAPALVGDYDVVVDGTDNLPTRHLINDTCLRGGKPYVYASVCGFVGELSDFACAGGPCYRCLYPAPPAASPAAPPPGLLGVLPGVIGVIQATETIKLLLGIGEPLVGRVLRYDALAMTFRTLRLARDPDCPACAH
jgi:sulfur-carrier protein adenylyltransferase/sulfurtransferase